MRSAGCARSFCATHGQAAVSRQRGVSETGRFGSRSMNSQPSPPASPQRFGLADALHLWAAPMQRSLFFARLHRRRACIRTFKLVRASSGSEHARRCRSTTMEHDRAGAAEAIWTSVAEIRGRRTAPGGPVVAAAVVRPLESRAIAGVDSPESLGQIQPLNQRRAVPAQI